MSDLAEEEVVFENSPLYQHLQRVGYTDFISRPTWKPTPSIQPSDENHLSRTETCFKAFSRKCYVLIGTFLIDDFKFQENTIVSNYQQAFINTLANSGVFVEEDRQKLSTYGIGFEVQSKNSNAIFNRRPFAILVLITALCLGYMCSDIDSLPLIVTTAWCLAVAVLTLYFMWSMKSVYHLWRTRLACERNLNKLGELIESISSSTILLKKSIRLIQEAEIIKRGFVLVSPLIPISRMEQSQQPSLKQCPRLRKEVFSAARKLILLYREMTSRLLEEAPLVAEVDSLANYLASISADSLGVCFTNEDVSEETRLEITDGDSLAVLKAIFNFAREQMSEFSRRLAFCYSLDAWTENSLQGRVLIDKTGMIIESAFVDTAECLVRTKRCYDLHKDKVLGKKEVKGESHLSKTPNQQDSFGVALRSLQLHLQAASLSIQNLEERLKAGDTTVIIGANVQECYSGLDTVKRNLDASLDCYHESVTQLERLNKPADSNQREQAISQENTNGHNKLTEERKDNIYTLIKPENNQEIIFNDEIFEGYTDDPNEVDMVDESSPDSWLMSLEEKELRKRENENSTRILSELKTVLAIRSVEREKMILQRHPDAKLDKVITPVERSVLTDIEGDDGNLDRRRTVQTTRRTLTVDRNNTGDPVDSLPDDSALDKETMLRKLKNSVGDTSRGFSMMPSDLAAQVASRSRDFKLNVQTFVGAEESSDDAEEN